MSARKSGHVVGVHVCGGKKPSIRDVRVDVAVSVGVLRVRVCARVYMCARVCAK